jgi:hypothetical protein
VPELRVRHDPGFRFLPQLPGASTARQADPPCPDLRGRRTARARGARGSHVLGFVRTGTGGRPGQSELFLGVAISGRIIALSYGLAFAVGRGTRVPDADGIAKRRRVIESDTVADADRCR